ncbi:MAG: hypothetical protein JRI25_19485 [Deltaproteobacteria bacterium]|nr:hypothetical protein [Deltaproteobacteria bacterium]
MTFAVALTAMVVFTAGVIIAVTYANTRSSSLLVSRSILTQVTRVTEERVKGFLQAPAAANELILRDLQSGALDPFDRAGLEARFYNTLTVYSSLNMIAFADEEGDFLMVKRMPDGALWTKDIHQDQEGQRRVVWTERPAGADRTVVSAMREDRADAYDPRVRPWYVGAKATGEPFWTDVYVFFTDKAPGMTASVPLTEDGELIGVVAVDVSLESFSRFLATLDVSERGAVFLVDQRRRVIGNPDLGDLVAETAQEGGRTELVLKQADQSGNQALVALASSEAFAHAVEGRGEQEFIRFEAGGAPHIAALRPIQEGAGDWVIAVVAPEADFLADVERLNRQNLLTALFFSLATVLLSVLLSRRITHSLQRLVSESAKIQALQFDEQVDTHTPFKEVHDALSAFDGMKTGLRSLQKYLPMKLVRVLLENHQEPQLGGDLVEVTVLFSDIAGFTTISEALGPGPVARRLGVYLGGLTRQIQSRQGTVAHYIGDGIMAFWGAPVPVPDHAVQACHAALECADIVAGLWADEPDAPQFHTRFGLHTATVAVGHFGTPERMAYSAMGDGVNLSSRLEGLSKQYGTTILISEDTWNLVSEHFEGRSLDSVRVKGKVKAVTVYELLGVKGAVSDAVLAMKEQYERGLRHYRSREWGAAIGCFDAAVAQVPADRASVVLRERCLDYQVHPPPEGWQGEFTMTVK